MSDFAAYFQQATGRAPYDYQARLATHGFPDVLAVPTGAGKTAAAVLPWLYRRATAVGDEPSRLVFTLPMRTLVEQTYDAVTRWLTNLGRAGDVGVYRLMGGETREQSEWRYDPHRDAILVGTQDIVLSAVLNRGYGVPPSVWPIDLGLLSSDSFFVFDEVQLMGPGVATSRQLQAFRDTFGTAAPTRSMWMSATVDDDRLRTVDNPVVGTTTGVADADRTGPLRTRLEDTRTVRRANLEPKTYAADIARLLVAEGGDGMTLAILNSVERAQDVYQLLVKEVGAEDVALLHSRFRPRDRRHALERVLAMHEAGGGYVVSTQVLEAGVDISARMLFTEAAPWPSIVQRAGRCNRDGTQQGATLLWAPPPKPAPYDAADVSAAVDALNALGGAQATPESIRAVSVATVPQLHAVLRRTDLVDLFDTAPDLSGSYTDVSRFVRDADEVDATAAWWATPPATGRPLPGRDERCPVPLGDLRSVIGQQKATAWVYDATLEDWRAARGADVHPGAVVVLSAATGCYSAALGWRRGTKGPVGDLSESAPAEPTNPVVADTGLGSDPLSLGTGEWIALERHLADVEARVRQITAARPMPGLSHDLVEAAAVAGRLHDIGKAHDVFQDMLRTTLLEDEPRPEPGPWAKSARGGGRSSRRYFRHELAGALALLGESAATLDGVAERDLVVYLVAAHHGRVRLAARAPVDERKPSTERTVLLGVQQGDVLPAVTVPGGALKGSVLDLEAVGLGALDGRPSWTRMTTGLLGRADLGPFRLSYLEALVRVADWWVSRGYEARA